ncbi:PKD domain-containing protein [Candidatus Woesearchaeota archaeon]|jgi:PKD repeat protein|nr:PKD domain-containing protein [Candidatus Woesearchaeota archaeon]MBT3537748.1 PKD domain-containing protein [Candidatus Woesearchaeota archaeon]MBT4697879.1 PKD domain-containing protein [Candidatus Woesearchaeota archaeon]MBT4717461.1 PKD domain-containing protein [Candidatus Woesearchaeota archaeon]MBT7105417.1 PKD domain-containing protein [Candidatus Woesearchaeota archaeon]
MNVFRNKNANVEAKKLVRFLIAAFVIIILLYFALTSLKSIRTSGISIDVVKFSSDMRAITDTMTDDYASARNEELTIQENVNEVCILDLFHRLDILDSPVIEGYPIIKNSLLANVQKNVFLYEDGEFLNSMFVGDFCYQDYPYFDCYEIPKTKKLALNVEGKGTCTQINTVFRSCKDVQLDSNGATKDYTYLETGSASLQIPEGTRLQFPQNAKKANVCLEATKSSSPDLASEVHRITPEDTLLLVGDLNFKLKFKEALVPKGVDEKSLILKHFDTSQDKWLPLATDIDKKINLATPESTIAEFGKYAVFLPGRPTAIISSPLNEDLYKHSEFIVFNGSQSYDAKDDDLDYVWTLGDGETKDLDQFTYSYSMPGLYPVTLTVTNDEGVSDESTVEVSVRSPNIKDETKYSEDPVFMIYKNEQLPDLLTLIPIATWNDYTQTEMRKYNYYAYFGFSANIVDWHLDEMMSKHGSNLLYWFTHSKGVPTVVQDDPIYGHIAPTPVTYSNIVNYWETFEEVVIVERDANGDQDTEQLQLLAALYGSFINAPVLYIDASVWTGNYDSVLDPANNLYRVYLVGNVNQISESDLVSSGIEVIKYSIAELSNPTINPYVSLTGQVFPSFFVGDDLFMGSLDGEVLYCSFDQDEVCIYDGNDIDLVPLGANTISYNPAKVVNGATITGDAYLVKDSFPHDVLTRMIGTVSFWVKFNDLSGIHYIFSDRGDLKIFVEDSKLHIQLKDNLLEYPLDSTWTTEFKLVVFRWDVLADMMSLVVDNQVAKEQEIVNPGFTLNNKIGIGNKLSVNGEDKPLDGTIDELRIFNKYLTAAEIDEGLMR